MRGPVALLWRRSLYTCAKSCGIDREARRRFFGPTTDFRRSMKLPLHAAFHLVSPALLVVGHAAWAQQAPSAGNQLQQIPAPPSVAPRKPEMQVDVDTRQPAAGSEDTTAVVVKDLVVTGAAAVAPAELIRVSGFAPGTQYTLNGLRNLASRMSAHYHAQGYFLAQTYLPAQDITDGVVRFTVVEGQYGEVKLQNRSALADATANGLLSGLKGAGVVNASALERRLLLLSDLPGVVVKSVMTPGSAFGSTDLLVDVAPGQAIAGSLEADNLGNSYTGANRVGASIQLNEPTGLGDVATARLLTSGEGLTYGRVSYQALLGSVNAGLAYTSLQYKLGGDFASTQSSGTARVGSVYANYALMRSRGANLSVQWSSDNKAFSDRSDAVSAGASSDKSVQVSTATLRGDFRDASGAGFTNYAVTWTRGRISLHDAMALLIDANSAQSDGAFDKLTYALARQQSITTGTDLHLSVSGQWASKNLDASEKFSLGGAGGVRAYPSGEASGDEGVVVTLESRTLLPGLSDRLSGTLQLVGFVDAGTVTLNKNPWDTSGVSNQRMLKGAGLGVNYAGSGNLMVRAYCAFRLGSEAATSAPDASGRVWLQMSKAF